MTGEPDVSDLRAAVAAVPREAGTPTTCSIPLPSSFDPRQLLADPLANNVVASYERSDRGFALVGIGEAARVDVPAGAGPASVRGDVQTLLEGAAGNGSDGQGGAPGLRPRLMGGFRFNAAGEPGEPWQPFGAGWLVLPELLFVRDGEATGVVLGPGVSSQQAADVIARMTVRANIGAGARPGIPEFNVERPVSRTRWNESVERIATEVRAGAYEKAVLASSMVVAGPTAVAPGPVLDRLRTQYPECFVFSFRQHSADDVADALFLGASPELLVSLMDGRVHALGLAGSTSRGATPDEDERLGAVLLASAKDRIEHETVVRAIRERLEGATEELRAPNQPELRRLRNIQHLATDITGRVRPGVHILDLVQRVHPTPAVCGWPAARAREVIAEHEAFDRGWYAGPVGWIDDQGDGEFAVALRSAVVRGERAWLFAGNGIMGDSQPEAEYAEVQLKFRPLIDALAS